MMSSMKTIAVPPGATIKEQIADRGISQQELASMMGMSEKDICKLLNGEVRLSDDIAVRLETVLGIPTRFWSNLERIYREKKVQAENERYLEK